MTENCRWASVLLEKGVLTEDQLRIAVLEQEGSQDTIGRVLVNLGFVTEATIRDVLSETQNAETVDLRQINVDPDALNLIPMEIAKRYNILPFALKDGNNLSVAVANPNDMIVFEQIRAMLGSDLNLNVKVASESDIARAVDEYYGLELTIEGILREIESGEADLASQAVQADSATASHPIVRLVNAFLSDAVKRVASDVHFEPEQSFLRVRYRIDGVLRQIRSLHRSYWQAMCVRLKVMSDMDIAEGRQPQDGKISMTLYGHKVDFRAAAHPTAHGENFVLRILDQQKSIVPITELGLNDRALNMLQLMVARPTGLLLVTGPTGSGKTTTLYSFLNHVNNESVNIMTLEDPDRISHAHDSPVAGKRKQQNGLGIGNQVDSQAGSGHRPDRRDSGQRDRRHGPAGGNDRAPGPVNPAYQFRHRGHTATA